MMVCTENELLDMKVAHQDALLYTVNLIGVQLSQLVSDINDTYFDVYHSSEINFHRKIKIFLIIDACIQKHNVL
jgi:hypothetical protein